MKLLTSSLKHPITGPIISIVLKGGPCAGKTTILKQAMLALMGNGNAAVSVPEAASTLLNNNVHYMDYGVVDFHLGVAEMQINQENTMMAILQRFQKRKPHYRNRAGVVLLDRGLFDIAAYFPRNRSDRILRAIVGRMGMTVEDVRKRYAGVIHMVTAADGAEKFYGSATNTVRIESAEKARELDRQTLEAWSPYSQQIIVDNVDEFGQGIDFRAKTDEVIGHVLGIVKSIENQQGIIAA